MILKVHIPKTRYNRFPNPYKMGTTPFGLLSLRCGNRATYIQLRNLVEDPGSCHQTAQLPGSCFPTPIGPQHSLVACPQATSYCTSLMFLAFFNYRIFLVKPSGVNVLQFFMCNHHFHDASLGLLQRFFCDLFCEQFTHCSLCFS